MATPNDIANTLNRYIAELSDKDIARGMRQTLATEARKVKRAAVHALAAARTKARVVKGHVYEPSRPIAHAKELGKTISASPTKKLDGFYISVAIRQGKKTNKYRTSPRYSKRKQRITRESMLLSVPGWLNKGTKNHIEGRNFIGAAEKEADAAKDRIIETLKKKYKKIAEKYA